MVNKRKEKILGSRRLSNYWWAITISVGGLAFIFAGLSSYFSLNVFAFSNLSNLIFVPQGATMMFYGVLAFTLGLFLWLTILWNVGAGYNEFDNTSGSIKVFRLGFPGKNRFLLLTYQAREVQSIKVNIKEGLAPKREIYLKMKDGRQIPLTGVGQPLLLSDVEDRAISLAKFLGVVLEGLN